MAELVVVASFQTPHEAALAKARLGEAGIPAMVRGEHHARLYGGMGALAGTIDVQVHADDEDAARRLLALDLSGYDEFLTSLEAEAAGGDEAETFEREERCPRCNSDSYDVEKRSPLTIFLSAFLLFIPLLFLKQKHECHICGMKW